MHSEGIVHAFRIVKALDFLGLGVDRVHTRAGNEQLTGDWVNLDFSRMLDSLLVPFLVRRSWSTLAAGCLYRRR